MDGLTTKVLGLLAGQVEKALGEKRRERVISRYLWVEGAKIANAVVVAPDLMDELQVGPDELDDIMGRLAQDDLVVCLNIAGENGYLATPVGYWLADQENGGEDVTLARYQVMELITEALQVRWRDATRSEKIEAVAMSPQYASFLLFMLIGGAVGAPQALKWSKHDIESAETARDLLIALCRDLGVQRTVSVWSRSEELANFIRRPQLKQTYGQRFHKEDNQRTSQSMLYFDTQPTVEGLTPLMLAVERGLGAEKVIAVLSKLESAPWAKDRAFESRSRHIRALFTRHLCPLEYREMLTQAAQNAAERLRSEGGETE